MANIIDAMIAIASQYSWQREWNNPDWHQYLQTGNDKHLKKLPKFKSYSFCPKELLAALPNPDQLDEPGKRFLYACYYLDSQKTIGEWINQCFASDASDGRSFNQALALLSQLGCPDSFLARQVAENVRPLRAVSDGKATVPGQYLLSLSDTLAESMYAAVGVNEYIAQEIVPLFVVNAPQQWKKLLMWFNKNGSSKKLDPVTWLLPLNTAPRDFIEESARAFELLENWHSRFVVGCKLHETDPNRFREPMEKLTTQQLLSNNTQAEPQFWKNSQFSALWLLKYQADATLTLLERYCARAMDHESINIERQCDFKIEVLDQAFQKLGRDALPLFESCFLNDQPPVQLHALKLWQKIKTQNDTPLIRTGLQQLFAHKDSAVVSQTIRLSGIIGLEIVEEDVWALLGHKSRPARDAAAKVLASLGESRITKTKELWAARRADTRIAAVAWLKELGTAMAAQELESRLEVEEDDNVRDAILMAIEKLQGANLCMDQDIMEKRILKAISKIDGPPADWIDLNKLPCPKLANGAGLQKNWLLYLLYRQSRVKEMRVDIEAKPLFAMLDRKTSGDLALAVLNGFFHSKADADDRWAMAFAAIVGDDRLIPVFTRQIKEWADNMRGKLAEYAVQALALLGTDAALLTVDAMSIRYRSKNKNIGKAAGESFAAAAQARGLTVEELGDLVVPWFGFMPGQPRVLDTGKIKIEARISNDFKLAFRDAATNKKIAKLPDSTPSELKNEFKELSSGLKEAVKSQMLRMETLMVRQFRWPVTQWRELYLRHPLLLPFAQRLIWGMYDGDGKLTSTFRSLEDSTLTDAADDSVTLLNDGHVGIIHPLELTPEIRQAWLRHLADYDVAPPFAQLERPVITTKPEQKDHKFGNDVNGVSINAMTFKGRAERLGWIRGSVCDAGGISNYYKTFPGSGVDAFIGLEDMYMGIDMYSDIKLGCVYFVKHKSVQVGSYTYDDPGDATDTRLVDFGSVPSIAFSETMGDLLKIAGKSEAASTEDVTAL